MMPLCVAEGIGVVPWGAIAKGRLGRPAEEIRATRRSQLDRRFVDLYGETEAEIANDCEVIDEVGKLAAQRGVTRAQIALAWLLHKPGVVAPIVGVTKLQQLDEALGSIDVALSAEEMERLERPYRPHEVRGI